MDVTRYAIVDGAVEGGLLDFLSKVNPPHCCLYAEPIQPDLVALAPYLVEVTPDVEKWLSVKDTPWGISLTSELSLRELQQHFRHYLWVMLPEQGKPVLMRFYDPRNIWVLAEVLTPRQLFSFIRPVRLLSTCYGGEYREDNFISARDTEAINPHRESPRLLTLTYRQYSQLERQAQENYLDTLSVFIQENIEETDLIISPENIAPRKLAEEYFIFCQSLNITDDHSVRIMARIFLRGDIDDTREMPDEWHNLLSDQTYPAHTRVQKLALQERGFIPQ